jgi:hypothetical protein
MVEKKAIVIERRNLKKKLRYLFFRCSPRF